MSMGKRGSKVIFVVKLKVMQPKPKCKTRNFPISKEKIAKRH